MKLQLNIISYRNQPPAAPISAVIDEQGGTVGRAENNACILPDTERFISSVHAEISFQDNHFVITDRSTNGLFLDQSDHPLGRDNSAVLNSGQCIVIGDYVIEVSTLEELQELPASPFGETASPGVEDDYLFPQEQPSTAPPPWEGTDPISDPLPSTPSPAFIEDEIGLISENNDFFAPNDGITSEPPAPSIQSGSEADNIPVENQFFQPPTPLPLESGIPSTPLPLESGISSSPLSQSIPEDWDILGDMEPVEQPPLENPIVPPISPSLPPEPGIPSTPLPLESGKPSIPLPLESGMPSTPLPLESGMPSTPLPLESGIPSTPLPLESGIPSTPLPLESGIPSTPLPAVPGVLSNTNSLDALNILFKGAKVDNLEVTPDEADAMLETIGELFREMLGGLMGVLRARADIKSEFRIQLTTIRPVENNPLKFSVNVDDALQHLLTSKNDAYIAPRAAINEAMDNIKAHQLAVMAGMQAALSSMLKRFEPSTLERYFEAKGGRGLLGSKKSWYWEQFEEKYKEVLLEAEDNFQDLFGEEFARAYQEQIKKLVQVHNLARKNDE